MKAQLFIDAKCTLAEGPLWHHLRGELLWFDIYGQKLFVAGLDGAVRQTFSFDQPVSAAAIIDEDTVAVAAASALWHFDLVTGVKSLIAPLEDDLPDNRSNDGRVDPAGGFWIGTMRRAEDRPDGAVYQYRAGQMRKLFGDVTITNSMCFAPDGRTAYFSDTVTRRILKCAIDAEGRPEGEWTLFADVSEGPGYPDGSVVDAEGYVWNARWGGSCVVRHAPDGRVVQTVELPAANVTCPAFGGPDLRTLFVTTARKNLSEAELAVQPGAGGIFKLDDAGVGGQKETSLKL